ncbi:uncharacterized protein LOC126382286 [Pectinophora gossypiella]|uniref:uncharacterized protein LOC126382286 n=1 Tax=Pectinophora gossypiella TaxID=13191 RepID=UPI00214E6B96|nr:uncharacterized protein LOC126382286 [Pectinophora gossypiella]
MSRSQPLFAAAGCQDGGVRQCRRRRSSALTRSSAKNSGSIGANAGYTWKAGTVSGGNRLVAPAPRRLARPGPRCIDPSLWLFIFGPIDTYTGRSQKETEQAYKSTLPVKDTSMSTLIIWNINKALEKNPKIELQSALKTTEASLERDSLDVLAIVSQRPEERHLSCALLAWQQLGHIHADSLCRFVEAQMKKDQAAGQTKVPPIVPSAAPSYGGEYVSQMESDFSKELSAVSSVATPKVGPVLRLPAEPKIVMRLDSQKQPVKDIKKKIEEACCLESGCVERLAKLDAQTKELRGRLAKLARREADRVELLERAEAAWRDLEIGYMKRLRDVTDKEGDLDRQKGYLLDDRNDHKDYCARLVAVLKPRGDAAEKMREQLRSLETTVCERACERMRQIELSAAEDAALADAQCKATQLDRDLQFKEEQARRKRSALESDLESARGLTYEADRTLRSELNGLKQQIKQVSKELLGEENGIEKTKKELAEFQQEKRELVEDLEGCQKVCDANMQKKVEELKTKRKKLQELKDKVVDCKCKLPMDVAVEVKRTPSLAALCQCRPEDKALDSCSCTSFRSRLLSDLLSDLFGGLQGELGSTGSKMPCQLLKCLEDRHNWDRASIVKSNLRAFFAKLLVGELDIAIATSIEKYHAKWVGASCADIARPIPDVGGSEHEGWEGRALEYKAKRMAARMAEQMFKERAEEIMQRAKDVVAMGPPPCDCKPPSTAIMTCLVEPPFGGRHAEEPEKDNKKKPVRPTPPLAHQKCTLGTTGGTGHIAHAIHRTINDVSQLRAQVEDLKKEPDSLEVLHPTKCVPVESTNKKENECHKPVSAGSKPKKVTPVIKKRPSLNEALIKPPGKPSKRFGRQYAVNLCLCGMKGIKDKNDNPKEEVKGISQMPSIRQSKPISQMLSQEDKAAKNSQSTAKNICGSQCACFNKIPSISSFDELLETLAKWKCDLGNDYIESKNDNVLTAYNYIKSASDKISFKVNHASKLLSQSSNKTPNKSSKVPEVNLNTITKETECTSHPTQKEGYNFGRILTTNTESEYMGAVNLEKSNENFCKCIIDGETNIIDKTKTDEKNPIAPVKYTVPCKCDDHHTYTKNMDTQNKEVRQDIKKQIISKTDMNHILADADYVMETQTLSNGMRKVVLEDFSGNMNKKRDRAVSSIKIINKKDEYHEQPATVPNASQIIKTPECDCGYQIKFLGVTLANNASNKKITNTPKDSVNITYMPKLDKDCITKVDCPLDIFPHNLLHNSDSFKSNVNDNNKIIGDHQLKCHCKVNMEELKALFSNNLHKNIGDSNQDKALDTRSFIQEVTEKQDDCVCCVNNLVEDWNDLEVNTFHLLEEHLKSKLEEFKESCDHPSCVHPNEEGKLFTKILHKIKQTITESTDKVLCKCSEETPSEGSWQRAYGLLQEYLKTKIHRVQCTCNSPKQTEDDIVPELTNKVCNLIENDFQRLKDMCKCKNTEKIMTKSSNLNESNLFLMPEKDTNENIFNSPSHNNVKGNKLTLISNIAILKTQNTSAQVIPKLENKSCDAIGDHVKKTVETQNTETFHEFKHCVCCNLSSKEKDIINQSTQYSKTNQDFNIQHTDSLLYQVLGGNNLLQDIEKTEQTKDDISIKTFDNDTNLDKTTTLPLIGYTVDCSCNQCLGSCVCTKSMVQENNVAIDNLWKTYTNFKTGNQNETYPYIMDNIYKKDVEGSVNKIPEYILTEYTEFRNQTSVFPALCNVTTSAQDIGSIALKVSKEDVGAPPTYHTSTNTVVALDDESNSISDVMTEEAAEWFECASQAGYETMRSRSTHTPKNLYGSKSDTVVERLSDRGTTVDRIIEPSELLHEGCGCSLVPVCHVKMLVENIENKLFNSECTCDAMSAEVCPVHSRRFIV